MTRSVQLGLGVLLVILTAAGPVEAEIFVSRSQANEVWVYRDEADLGAEPIRVLGGPGSVLDEPWGLAVDPGRGELYVASRFADAVHVFSWNAAGPAAPLRTLAGHVSTFRQPSTLAFDAVHDELIVGAGDGVNINPAFYVFSATASGVATPLRRYENAGTLFDDGILDVEVDPLHGEIFVLVAAQDTNNHVLTFDRLAESGDAPLRMLAGGATGIAGARGVVLDAVADELIVGTDLDDDALRFFPRAASGNVAPSRSILGPTTQLGPSTGRPAVRPATREVLVIDGGSSLVTFAADAMGDVAPVRTVSGGAMPLSGALDALFDGRLFGDGFETGDTSAWSLVVQ
ncbi:MAG TPA: hypothetical protein VF017_17860 [Thermoanaerobaculia bacterium]|nr:hypothetical protein [Thermoanaerobaculia bacterium]